MTRAMIAPLLFGLIGAAVLVSLGVWQVQRLAWKEGVLTRDRGADRCRSGAGAGMCHRPDGDRYLPVEATGRLGEEEVHVLVSRKQIGAGYRIITALDTGQPTVPCWIAVSCRDEDKDAPRALHDVTVVGQPALARRPHRRDPGQ